MSLPPETKRLHEGLIRALIMGIRAWQDWLKAKAQADVLRDRSGDENGAK